MFFRHPKDARKDSLTEFSSLLRSIQKALPIAPSSHALRWFLANGSSISLELGGSARLDTALIEVATPETRSPRELVCYQIANERVLQKAFEANRSPDHWSLIKSNSDAYGHTLGQHESYDMRIARGIWLLAWWFGLLVLFLPLIVYRAAATMWLGLMLLISICLRGVQGLGLKQVKSRVSLDDLESSDCLLGFPMASWQLVLAASGLRRLHGPIVWLFSFLLFAVALRPHRKKAVAFLASRSLLDGSGHLDPESRFWISSRAAVVDRVIGFGSYNKHRPIFRCDPLLRMLLAGPYWSFSSYARLFRPVQRIEIAFGDSGLCQQGQWLRIGTTALVLDWVEQSVDTGVVQLRRVCEAMREFARDWMLVRTVQDHKGNDFRAREISRIYLRTLKSWLEKRHDVPSEAWEIVELWQMTLNQMDTISKTQGELPMMLVGKIDWVSKLWLMQQLGKDTQFSVKKKIDIRYHEISDQGYYWQLVQVLQLPPLISERDIRRATRVPPSKSPAWRRGNLIREFSDSQTDLVVGWESARYAWEGEAYRVVFPR